MAMESTSDQAGAECSWARGGSDESPVVLVSLGEAVELTRGQGRGSSEDKRRAYN